MIMQDRLSGVTMKKRLMILGASYTQNPLYMTARSLGITTIAASIPGDYPGFDLADEKAYADISDPEQVLAAAGKLQIDGIATCGLDLGMRSIGHVCEALGLPGPSRSAALKASDKWEMKKALTAAGVQTARFFCIHNTEELEAAMEQLPWPVILKATDQMGGRGIIRCDTREEVLRAYPKVMEGTKRDYCLLEEFIAGELFGVEAMIRNGRMVFILPNNTEAFTGDTPTPIGHSVPLRESAVLGGQILEQTQKAVRALGLDNCPVNCDFIKKDGKVYVIELTGRSGATGLSEMTGLYYGINYYEAIVKTALGLPVEDMFTAPGTQPSVLTHTLISSVSGRVGQIRVDESLQRDPHIKDLSFNIREGDEIRKYTNGRDRIGQVILTGTNLADCEKRLAGVLAGIDIRLAE